MSESAATRHHHSKNKGRKKAPKKVTSEWLHNAGLHYLQRFSASTTRFRQVMTRKIDRSCRYHEEQDRTHCLQKLDELIEKFLRAGLLNDTVYSEGAVKSLMRRGLSRRGMEARLREKGLSFAQIRDALDNLIQDQEYNELASALQLIRRKRLGHFRLSSNERQDRDMAALARAGYDYETARRALQTTREDAEKIIAGLSG